VPEGRRRRKTGGEVRREKNTSSKRPGMMKGGESEHPKEKRGEEEVRRGERGV